MSLRSVPPSPPSVSAPDRARHELALLLEGRCRHCAEKLPRGAVLRGEACPLCGSPTSLTEQERDALVQHLERRSGVRLGLVAVVVGLSQLLVGWFPLLTGLVTGTAAAWVRFRIVRPSLSLLSAKRLVVALWTGRLLTAVVVVAFVVLQEMLTLLPWVGEVAKVVITIVELLFVGWFNQKFSLWHVRREERGVAVAWWEWAILAGVVLALVAAMAAIAAASVAIAHAIHVVAVGLVQ